MSSSGSDETGVTDDVRVRMLEEENIKLKSQILRLQEKFTQLSKTNFEQTTRNMSPRSMIKKKKSKIESSWKEIPKLEKESESSDILEEAASIVEMADIAAESAGYNGDLTKNIWKQSNCLEEEDMFEEMEENERFVDDTNGMRIRSKIKNVSGQSRIKKPDDSERDKLLDYIEKEEGNTLMYRCNVCDKTSKRMYNMKDHVENIHFPGMFSYPCNFCDKTLPTKQSFRKHKEFHKTKSVPGLIEKRNRKNYSILSDYVEIVETESNVFVFCCKVCGKISENKSNLIVHIEAVHFPGCYIHFCKVCMKNFDTRQSLYAHTAKANHRKTFKMRARNMRGRRS